MMRGRRIDELATVDAYSLCGSRISISLSTIQEECSFDYFSSQSSFGTVSSFDSAMISAESLCSGCRFESIITAKGAKNKTSKLMPSIPAHSNKQMMRPKEIIFEGLEEMEHQCPSAMHSNLIQNARRPLRSYGSSSGESFGSSSYHSRGAAAGGTGGGAEYNKPLNDDDGDGDDGENSSYLRRTSTEAPLLDDFVDTPEYSRPLNDEYDNREYSRPLNDDPQQHYHYGYSHHLGTYSEEEKIEEDDPLTSSNRLPDSSEWIRQFDDMRLISSPMPSPASSCSSLRITVETILSNPDSLRSLDD